MERTRETTTLYPTKTRLALLRDIQGCRVVEDWYDGTPGNAWRGRWPQRTKVTGRIAEFRAAGWCEPDPKDADLHVRFLALTAAGLAVLAEHTPEDR
jgi:hypothetical protein